MAAIDFRSDTVTRPTPEMRRAMAEAEVGDDVWGDDPTVIELERELAALLGKEAAVYVPSGSMGNQVAIRSQVRPGDEVLVHELAHVVVHEQGGIAALSGAQPRMLPGERGVLELDVIERNLRDPSDPHHAIPSLVCLENTHRRDGRAGLPGRRASARSAALAHERGLRVHLDGARLWNAAVASGRAPSELVAEVDSVSVCFSKGLGAPVGSARGRRRRADRAGAPQPQAVRGRHAPGRDHRRRRALRPAKPSRAAGRRPRQRAPPGRGPGRDAPARDRPAAVETNIVLARPADGSPAAQIVAELAEVGVWCADLDPRTVRFVTHLDVDSEAIETALELAGPVLQ